MQKIIYEEFTDELHEKDRIIEEKDKEHDKTKQELKTEKQAHKKIKQENKKLAKTNNEYKNKIEKLNQIKDLNTPEARKIIDSLMLL